ncbi:MAG: dihydrolipoyl dehydrogenase [Candidatus Omnitrophica bacterium]|nr:dihydrolipoyl dehydrogenase [Candidatus Omnitrophota bacterium]
MSSSHTQLVIIGAGPGGYVATFLAADLGVNVTLVDERNSPGGVCLHCGCIPSKALLYAGQIIRDTQDAAQLGLEFGPAHLNLDKLRTWKNSVVQRLTLGLTALCKQRKITFIQGRASLLSANSAIIRLLNGEEQNIKFDQAILATGSSPIKLPFLPENPGILNSTQSLEIAQIPEKLLIIGGGYIGLEMATIYSSLGAKVTISEALPRLLPNLDRDIAGILLKNLRTACSAILTGTTVTAVEPQTNGFNVNFTNSKGQITKEYFNKILVSVGRQPNTTDLGLAHTKIQIDPRGFIAVNDFRQTAEPNIYAIGDITGQPMLAHKASYEAKIAVANILEKKLSYGAPVIPGVIFTRPQIAWCGLTETEAEEKGVAVKVAKFLWAASGKALATNHPEGLTKILMDPNTEKILGMQIAGAHAGEMISQGVLAMQAGLKAEAIAHAIHPHPTLSETIMETAEMLYGLSAHVAGKTKI